MLFKDKEETFGTPLAQRAWAQMNPGMCFIVINFYIIVSFLFLFLYIYIYI